MTPPCFTAANVEVLETLQLFGAIETYVRNH